METTGAARTTFLLSGTKIPPCSPTRCSHAIGTALTHAHSADYQIGKATQRDMSQRDIRDMTSKWSSKIRASQGRQAKARVSTKGDGQAQKVGPVVLGGAGDSWREARASWCVQSIARDGFSPGAGSPPNLSMMRRAAVIAGAAPLCAGPRQPARNRPGSCKAGPCGAARWNSPG